MKVTLIHIGKTDKDYIKEGISLFSKRISHYVNFNTIEIADIKKTKKLTEEQQKTKEGGLILQKISTGDEVILLDEKGKQFSSVQFANFIEQKMINSSKSIVFVIGGPYGFSKEVYQRADSKFSLSLMTFSHQMVRVIFLEQLYRAFTIIKGEPYHHS